MSEVIGRHLLGRRPSPIDERDYKLTNFLNLGTTFKLGSVTHDPVALIDLGIAELKKTTVPFKRWAATSYPDVTKTHWWLALNYFELAKIAATPPPIIKEVIEWENPDPLLNQGDTPHCVGFSGAHWGNTLPINDHFVTQDGHDLYYECKVLEGEPGQENGAYVRSLAKALLNRKRVTVYAFATFIDEAIAWIKQKGPVVFGTTWYEDMFFPNANGFVIATGPVAGGHAYLANGYDSDVDEFLFINSWGTNWGLLGHFRMSKSDAIKLLADSGEIMAAVELPLL